jgi:hypothetical protein
MTTFAFPSITPTTNTFELVANTRTFQSPLTNAVQTSSRKGSLWKASLQFNNLSGDDRQEMQAFLVKLNGQQHRFTLHDHSYTRRGAGGGTLVINGASQSGTALVCDGATANVNNYLRAGDYISFNNELHMVVVDANSDASGNVTLSIAPPIRKTPADNTLVDYLTPVSGVFMLAGPASWDTQPGIISSFTIEAVEDVLA